MDEERDTLFESGKADPFQFDERVSRVFADMIARSVPGYGLFLEVLAVLARRYVHDGAHVYDLGCSLGASSLAILDATNERRVRLTAVDSSAAMVGRARQAFEALSCPQHDVSVVEADIRRITFDQPQFVVLGFTLQFLEPSTRRELLERIAAAMPAGGALVLAEKVHFDASDTQRLQTELHLEFKRLHAYSEMEIAGKRQALENVLVTDTAAAHGARLRDSGFARVTPVLQAFNFITLLAERDGA